jgi:hypothetical protein
MKLRAVKITDETLEDWRRYQKALLRGADDPEAHALDYKIHGRLQSLLYGLDDLSEQIHRLAYPDPHTRPPRLGRAGEDEIPLED